MEIPAISQYSSVKKIHLQQSSQIIPKQKTEQLFWRGFGGRNRPPIGGLGDSPPNLSFCPTDENSYHIN
ncbi:hypothetical protein BV375_11465 [Nostoc sp. 106C]|nr:hypothetical protein BV375_11465 [Nostoc sp. 106C]